MVITAVNADGSQSQVTIPDFSIPVLPGGPMPSGQLDGIDGIKKIFVSEDNEALQKYNVDKQGWLDRVTQYQGSGVPKSAWPAKPVQPLSHTFSKVLFAVTGVAWMIPDASVALGEPCPDPLPPTPSEAPTGTIQPGTHIGGAWWNQGPADNPPDDVFNGTMEPTATSMDGVTGKWLFVASIQGDPRYGRRGWYQLQKAS